MKCDILSLEDDRQDNKNSNRQENCWPHVVQNRKCKTIEAKNLDIPRKKILDNVSKWMVRTGIYIINKKY